MRFTNPICIVALVAAIIPASQAIDFTFWVPMQASQFTSYDKIISGTKATENKFELTYEERYVASNPGNRRCFNETNALYGQPGVAMMSDSTGNCVNLQHYESIAYISLEGPSEESQPLNISMEGYNLFCNMTVTGESGDQYWWFVDLGVWAVYPDRISRQKPDTFNIVCRNSSNTV